jgi:hypothetical protein
LHALSCARADGDHGQSGFGIPGKATLEYFLEVHDDGREEL